MATKTYDRLLATRFDALLPRLDPRIKNVEAARAVMVDGESARQVAQRFDRTSETIRQSCRAIWALHLSIPDGLPPGWARIEVCLPQELIQVVRDMEESARKRLQAEMWKTHKGVDDESSSSGQPEGRGR
jgi:hypothetical protein